MKQLLKNSIITFIIAVVCLSCCFLNAAVEGITIDNVTTNLTEIFICSTNVQSNCTIRIQCINDKIDACNENLTKAIVSCSKILSNINNNSAIETNLEDFCESTNKINIAEIKTDIEESKKEIQEQIGSFNNLTNKWETNRKNLNRGDTNKYKQIYTKTGYISKFDEYVTNFTTSTNQFYAKTNDWEKEIDKINDSFKNINTLISEILKVANEKIVDPEKNNDELEELDKLKDYLCEHGTIKFDCENTREIVIKIANTEIKKDVPCGEEIPFEQIKLDYLKSNPGFDITGWETNGNLVVAKINVKVTISGQDAWYEYGTKVSDIEDKNANGKTFEYWSEKENGEKYTKEEITTPITLYPVYKKCEKDSSDIVNGKCTNPNCPSNLPPPPKCNICGLNLGANGKCPDCQYCPIHKDTVLVSGKCSDCKYCPTHENTVLVSGKCPDCQYCPTHENTVLVSGKCSECQYCPIHKDTVLVSGKCSDCKYCPIHKDTVLVSGKCSECQYCPTHENTVLVSGKCPKCVIPPPPPKGWLYEVTLFIEKYISFTQAIVADVILFIILIVVIFKIRNN